MRRVNSDVIIATVLLVVSSAFFFETFRYQKVHLAIVGSKLWPRVAATALFFVAVIYLFKSLRQGRSDTNRGWSLKQWLTLNRNVLICFIAYAVFLASLPYVGMLMGGTLFVFVTLTLLGKRTRRDHLIHALIALVSIGTMWAIFTFGLGVILPQGELLPKF